jgi:hypothetical protein
MLKIYAEPMSDKLTTCNTHYSKWQLFQRLASSDPCININGFDCILQGIQRVFGNGSSFILSVTYGGTYYSSYCRTLD